MREIEPSEMPHAVSFSLKNDCLEILASAHALPNRYLQIPLTLFDYDTVSHDPQKFGFLNELHVKDN